ncbi:MAG: hypothetical protein D6738_00865, partial [Acidobacteria bacterium]
MHFRLVGLLLAACVAAPGATVALDDPGLLVLSFNELAPGEEITEQTYLAAGVILRPGPLSPPGSRIVASTPARDGTPGPCDGSIAVTTDPFDHASIMIELVRPVSNVVSLEVGDFGPSDPDRVTVCAYTDASLDTLLECRFRQLGTDIGNECVTFEFRAMPVGAITIESQSVWSPSQNSFYIDNLVLDGECDGAEVVAMRQDDPAWAGDPLGETGGTIGDLGSQLTSLAMVVDTFGAEVGVDADPGLLGSLLAAEDDGFVGPIANPFAVVRVARRLGVPIGYRGSRTGASADVAFDAVCFDREPLAVGLDTTAVEGPDHWVVVRDQAVQDDEVAWAIADPAGRADRLGEPPYGPAFDASLRFSRGDGEPALAVAADGGIRFAMADEDCRQVGEAQEAPGGVLREFAGPVYVTEAVSSLVDPATSPPPVHRLEWLGARRGRFVVRAWADAPADGGMLVGAWDGAGLGPSVRLPLAVGPDRRAVIEIDYAGPPRGPLDVSVYENREPQVAARGGGVFECRDGVGRVVLESLSTDPDCDVLDHAWTGPFLEGGGEAHGRLVELSFPVGEHVTELRVDDGLVVAGPERVLVTVEDTMPPSGRIVFPRDGDCLNGPVTIRDVFDDVCDDALDRLYEPGPGPTYVDEGLWHVTLTATDDAGLAAVDDVLFVIDDTPPFVEVHAPPLEPPGSPPAQLDLGDWIVSHDEDAAPGRVVRERLYVDDCLVLDGDADGDGDGLLVDESIPVSRPFLCMAARRCQRLEYDHPRIRFVAEDCTGQQGSDEDVIDGFYVFDERDCP